MSTPQPHDQQGTDSQPPQQLDEQQVQQFKAKLRELLNEAHTLRLELKRVPHPPADKIEKLKDLADQCHALSSIVTMEHGKGLALELLFTAKLYALDEKGNADPHEYLELEADLKEAEKIAVGYQDKNLESRILEGLANIYRRADEYEKEIRTIDRAILLGRTIPKVMALLDAHHRIINYLYEKEPNNADALVKFNTDYWSNYLWLKEQPEFNRNQFILQKKVLLYKVALYIGSLAGSPFNSGEKNPEDQQIAQEAYDEAIYIAKVLNNNEFLCAAHAHKAMMLTPNLKPDEKRQLLKNLKFLEETYHPENIELSEMIKFLENQLGNSQ